MLNLWKRRGRAIPPRRRALRAPPRSVRWHPRTCPLAGRRFAAAPSVVVDRSARCTRPPTSSRDPHPDLGCALARVGSGCRGSGSWGGVRIRATRGWISVDRGSKATLPLTIPRRVFKSSAKDSARRPSGIALHGGRPRPLRRGGCACDTSPWGPRSPTAGRETDGGLGRRFTSLDSDLEAFSHNPAHGSFAPLAFQPSAMTNCVNQRFLSY